MQLKKIQAAVSKYKTYLKSKNAYKNLHQWEALQHFQDNWDFDTDDFADMYDRSLQNSKTKRLWKREAYFPKEMMLHFIKLEPDYTRHMFHDLFNENKAIDTRVDRFIFYCDELLRLYKKANPNSIENNHYHDYGIISLYLSFRYPEKYGLYDFDQFQTCLQHLGAINIPQVHDLPRFFKLNKTLWTFMQKEKGLMDCHQKRLLAPHYKEHSMLIVSEFMREIR